MQHNRKKSTNNVVTAKSREVLDKFEKGARLEVGGTTHYSKLISNKQSGKNTSRKTNMTTMTTIHNNPALTSEKAVMNTAVNNLFSKIMEKLPAVDETNPVCKDQQHQTASTLPNLNGGRPPTASRCKTALQGREGGGKERRPVAMKMGNKALGSETLLTDHSMVTSGLGSRIDFYAQYENSKPSS